MVDAKMTIHSNSMAATRVLGWAEVVVAGLAMLVAFYLMSSPLKYRIQTITMVGCWLSSLDYSY